MIDQCLDGMGYSALRQNMYIYIYIYIYSIVIMHWIVNPKHPKTIERKNNSIPSRASLFLSLGCAISIGHGSRMAVWIPGLMSMENPL